jgi:predicted oxidoreductase
VAEHWNAVHRYLQTGDVAGLRKFRKKRVIDADGKRVALLTDTAEIERYGSAGVLSFESLYARSA